MRNMLCAWHILTLIAFDEKISGVSIKSFCLLLKIQDWPSEDYNATPVTAIIEALSGDLETHQQLDTLLLTYMYILSASTGPNQPACENLHISLHSHRPAHLAADANSQFPAQTTHDSAQCHNVTMSHTSDNKDIHQIIKMRS